MGLPIEGSAATLPRAGDVARRTFPPVARRSPWVRSESVSARAAGMRAWS